MSVLAGACAVGDWHVCALARYKRERDRTSARRGRDDLARAAASDDENVYAAVVEATLAGATHGEIVAQLRDVLGFGEPLIVA